MLSTEGLELKIAQSPFLKELGRTGICSVLKMFSLSYTERTVSLRARMFISGLEKLHRELLFKHVLKQKHRNCPRDKGRRASEEETA